MQAKAIDHFFILTLTIFRDLEDCSCSKKDIAKAFAIFKKPRRLFLIFSFSLSYFSSIG